MVKHVQEAHNLIHDAYSRLSHDQLVLFLSLRSLPSDGPDEDLADRLAQYDVYTYLVGGRANGMTGAAGGCLNVTKRIGLGSCLKINGNASSPNLTSSGSARSPASAKPRQTSHLPDLPAELLAEILDQLGDWELSKAVGLPTSLPRPPEWNRASRTDEAMLSGFTPLIRAADPARNPPTKIGATLAIRFGYVHVLDMLYHAHRSQFPTWFRNDIIPICASHHGRTSILTWWKHILDSGALSPPLPVPRPKSVADAIDGACRTGAVVSLDWWLRSGFILEYTDTSLESASAKNHIAVLDWWKSSGLPLKVGRVMDSASSAGNVAVLEWWKHSALEFPYDRQSLHHASMHGKVEVLQWWLESGLQLFYDHDALTLATRHNRPEVLEWWDQSGLPAQYRICDIEEALEDAIGGGEAAREWWRKKGVNFNANDTEWLKLQTLN